MKLKFLVIAAAVLIPAALTAQSVEVVGFQVSATTGQQNPAVIADASGSALILMKLYRDAGGDLTNALVEFDVKWRVGQDETITAMHIHRGGAGTNGPIVVDSALPGVIPQPAGEGGVFRQALREGDGLAVVEEILGNPSGFYLNVHSVSNPPGIIRGQLRRLDDAMTRQLLSENNDLRAQNEALSAELGDLRELLSRVARRLGLVP